MTVVLLGPQRRPSLDRLVDAMGLDGPYATITAGWQERESDDAELDSLLRGQSRNLRLWHRMQEVFAVDPAYAAAHQQRRTDLAELQDLYQLGLSHAMQAITELQDRSSGRKSLRDLAIRDATALMRTMDEQHILRVRAVQADFYQRFPPHERPAVAHHREQVAATLAECAAVVLPGGHIVELLDALHLFNVMPAGLDRLPVIAWSAGAMALSSTVVLFNDSAVRGPGCPEVFDQGVGLLPGVVLLPSARQRLRTDDHRRMALMAARFAPSVCLPLDPGAHVTFSGADVPAGAIVIDADGAQRPKEVAGAEAGDQPPA